MLLDALHGHDSFLSVVREPILSWCQNRIPPESLNEDATRTVQGETLPECMWSVRDSRPFVRKREQVQGPIEDGKLLARELDLDT